MKLNSLNIINRIYFSIDRFFRAENIAGEKSLYPMMKISRPPGNHIQVEWDLHQNMADIAAKDIEVMFRRLTPHFLRKMIVKVQYLMVFFFNTDEELVDENVIILNDLFDSNSNKEKHILRFSPSRFVNSKLNGCFWRFTRQARSLIRKLIFIIKIQHSLIREMVADRYYKVPIIKVKDNPDHPIRGPGVFKLMPGHLYHQRN